METATQKGERSWQEVNPDSVNENEVYFSLVVHKKIEDS